jgi:hypothetical protein
MTLAQLVIVPGILLALFLGGLLVLASRLTAAWLRVLKARRTAAAIPAVRHRGLQYLAQQQGDAIAGVITELDSHRATYETFPQDVREALYAAHTAASGKELRG